MQEHLEDEDMSGECREEVTNDQIRSNQDYRWCSLPSFRCMQLG